jgi:excisionase family DNA binding protein
MSSIPTSAARQRTTAAAGLSTPEGLDVLIEVLAEAVSQRLANRATEPAKLLGVREAAARLGVSERTIRALIASGELRSLRVGRRRLVPVDAIADYVRGIER